MRLTIAILLAAAGPLVALAADQQGAAKLVDVRRIWNRAAHNAFTDLIRFRDGWVCVFREGSGHVSHDGKIRVIASADGREWSSWALLGPPGSLPDVRDPKITTTPDGRLMLTAVAALRKAGGGHQTYAWLSADGKDWGAAAEIGQRDVWLWRLTWHKGVAYGVGYGTAGRQFARLYRSGDGRKFDVLVERLFEAGYPNEASLAFGPDGRCLCLLRRDGRPNSAMLGAASPPYTEWTWRDLGQRIGGPHMIRLGDGRIVVAGRRYDGGARTSLMWLDADADKPTLREFLKLPSGGDTSYPGLVFRDGLLWVSYYASHEGKTSIYLAKIKL